MAKTLIDVDEEYLAAAQEVLHTETFLYNTGPIQSLTSPNWNRRPSYDVSVSSGFSSRAIGTGLACPPCNIGPLSTPDYGALAAQAVHQLGGGITRCSPGSEPGRVRIVRVHMSPSKPTPDRMGRTWPNFKKSDRPWPGSTQS